MIDSADGLEVREESRCKGSVWFSVPPLFLGCLEVAAIRPAPRRLGEVRNGWSPQPTLPPKVSDTAAHQAGKGEAESRTKLWFQVFCFLPLRVSRCHCTLGWKDEAVPWGWGERGKAFFKNLSLLQ